MSRASGKQMAIFTEKVIEQKIPQLKGQVEVEFDRRPAVVFEAHRQKGKVKILFTMTPKHPKWGEVIERVANAAYQLRFTRTTAEKIHMNASALTGKALVHSTECPQIFAIHSPEDAEWMKLWTENGGPE